MRHIIKNATVRKVRNRGYTPITVHIMNYGFVSGWVYKKGTKWLHFYSTTTGNKRLPLNVKRKEL